MAHSLVRRFPVVAEVGIGIGERPQGVHPVNTRVSVRPAPANRWRPERGSRGGRREHRWLEAESTRPADACRTTPPPCRRLPVRAGSLACGSPRGPSRPPRLPGRCTRDGIRPRHRDLLLIVEPGRRHIALAGEDQHLDHRQAPPDCVLVKQTSRGDRSIVGMRAEHCQRPVRPQRVTQRFSDVDELPMATEAVHGPEQAIELGAPVGQTRRWIGGVHHGL